MSFPEQSPERRLVKITYTSKSRRRDSVSQKENELVVPDSASENEEAEVKQEKPIKISTLEETSPGKPESSDSVRSKVTKRPHIEPLNLPGPTPRHKRDLNKFEFPADGSKNKHAKSSSGDVFSVSAEGTPRSDKPISSLSIKLASSVKASKRAGTPDSAFFNGNASVTSTPDKSRSVTRMTEDERLEYLRSEPNVGDVEPHRVFCKACDKWLVLNAHQRYVISHWKEHKARCAGIMIHKSPGKESDTGFGPDDDAVSVVQSVTASESISIATSQPNNAQKTRRTLDERKRYLEEDPLIDQVLPNEVHCQQCNTWIKLSGRTQYSLNKWQAHAERMHNVRQDGPSRRVQEAQARLNIINDSQAGEFAANWVVCRICSNRIQLSDKLNYDLTNWIQHKEHCFENNLLQNASPAAIQQSPKRLHTGSERKTDNDTLSKLPNISSFAPAEVAASPARPAARSSPSTATESTAVGSATERNLKPLAFIKRRREDDDKDNNLEERPSVRARTVNYEPPNQDPPRPWGWLLFPWEAFKRGFLEGLWSNAPH